MYGSDISTLIAVLVLLTVGDCFEEDRSIQTGVTSEATNICARNSACKYAICLRGGRRRNFCILVPLLLGTNCVCPPSQVCSRRNDMLEAGSPFVYHYRCRGHWRALGVPHA